MNDEALKALKGSIRKWKRIAEGVGADRGTENCPLCKLFLTSGSHCDGCPVMDRVGSGGCQRTPYDAWINATHDMCLRKADTAKRQRLALAEWEFLKSLLPPGKAPGCLRKGTGA